MGKYESIYDANWDLKLENHFNWNFSSNQWESTDKYYFYYSLRSPGSVLNSRYDGQVKLFPNPSNEAFNLEIEDAQISICRLYNSNAQLIKTLHVNQGLNTYNIEDLKAGFYLVQIPTKNGLISRKLIKD